MHEAIELGVGILEFNMMPVTLWRFSRDSRYIGIRDTSISGVVPSGVIPPCVSNYVAFLSVARVYAIADFLSNPRSAREDIFILPRQAPTNCLQLCRACSCHQ